MQRQGLWSSHCVPAFPFVQISLTWLTVVTASAVDFMGQGATEVATTLLPKPAAYLRECALRNKHERHHPRRLARILLVPPLAQGRQPQAVLFRSPHKIRNIVHVSRDPHLPLLG